MSLFRHDKPLRPAKPPEPETRPNGEPRRYGMFVARLECGHDFGPGKGYVGEAAYPGDMVVCVRCAPVPDGKIKGIPEEPGPPVKVQVVDVVYAVGV